METTVISYISFNQKVTIELKKIFLQLPEKMHGSLSYMEQGKRLRSKLMYEVGVLVGSATNKFLMSSVLIELIHTISLLHDDVLDAEKERRGANTLNYLHADKTAILSGNYLLFSGLSAFSKTEKAKKGFNLNEDLHRELRNEISIKITNLCRGEILQDLKKEGSEDLTFTETLEIARLKTGSLFALAFKIPILLAIKEAKKQDVFSYFSILEKQEIIDFSEECGYLFGTFYQLFDDLKDLQKDLRTVEGKKLRFNNWTYPSLIWKERDAEGLRAFLNGRKMIIPPETHHFIREQTYNKIKNMLYDLKVQISDQMQASKSSKLHITEQKNLLYTYLKNQVQELAVTKIKKASNFFEAL